MKRKHPTNNKKPTSSVLFQAKLNKFDNDESQSHLTNSLTNFDAHKSHSSVCYSEPIRNFAIFKL